MGSMVGWFLSLMQVILAIGFVAGGLGGLATISERAGEDGLPPPAGPSHSPSAMLAQPARIAIPLEWPALMARSIHGSTYAFITSGSTGTLLLNDGQPFRATTHLAHRKTDFQVTALPQDGGLELNLAPRGLSALPPVRLPQGRDSLVYVDPEFRSVLRLDWNIHRDPSGTRVDYGWSWHPEMARSITTESLATPESSAILARKTEPFPSSL
jgi:hypothetical protein